MRGMSVWQMRQANECLCGGSDEYCPCQNVDRMAQADREVDQILQASDAAIERSETEGCPFCAQSVIGPMQGRSDRWNFHCRGCGSVMEISAPTAELSIRNFNTRSLSSKEPET